MTYNFGSVVNQNKFSTSPVLAKTRLRNGEPQYHTNYGTLTLTESSSRTIICTNVNRVTINIKLNDLAQEKPQWSYNPWGVKTIYFTMSVDKPLITVKLNGDTANAEYSLRGATDGVFNVDAPSGWFMMRVLLVRKEFVLMVEPLTEATPIVEEGT